MNRKQFLYLTGLFGTSVLLGIGTHGWVAKGVTNNSINNNKRLVVIFLRGAVDGLNVVIPYGENDYYDARSLIAIPPPGEASGCLNLDDRFGLHPALKSLMPLWKQGSLAFIHASGSPDKTRSHFDAQQYLENGTPGVKKTTDGWMNRLLGFMSPTTPVRALNLGTTTPRILSGKMPIATLPTNAGIVRPLAIDLPETGAAFDQLYTGNDSLSKAYQSGRRARQQLLADLQQEMIEANNGAPLPTGFSRDAQQLAQILVKDADVKLAFLGLGGWDTHVNQGNSTGTMARNLRSLGDGLAALVKGLGALYSDTAIIVMSEFGRTVNENGNGGTDHGHGNVLWVLGGDIKGGKVYGEWPGLSESSLFEGRDLAVTTDFREVIANILHRHLQLDAGIISQVFPNYLPSNKIQLL